MKTLFKTKIHFFREIKKFLYIEEYSSNGVLKYNKDVVTDISNWQFVGTTKPNEVEIAVVKVSIRPIFTDKLMELSNQLVLIENIPYLLIPTSVNTSLMYSSDWIALFLEKI